MAIYINGHKYPHYDRGPGLTIATNVNQGKMPWESSSASG